MPLLWKTHNSRQNESDRRWLESTVRNAALFTDWWTKARIVQLAYPCPHQQLQKTLEGLPVYGGLDNPDIVAALRGSCDLTTHLEFSRQVDAAYVAKTLRAWESHQFTSAISRNFEVYAHRQHRNVFLITSTTPVSLGIDRVLPSLKLFRPLFNVDELAQIIRAEQINRITLRTHGYSNPAASFYQSFAAEADALNTPDRQTQAQTLSDDHLYIGYHWPSEQPITSSGLWNDYWRYTGVLIKFLVIMAVLAGLAGTLLTIALNWIGIPLAVVLWRGREFPSWLAGLIGLAHWYWIVPIILVLWLLVFFLLRIVVYQRDRYRAVHYGAPDLAEFFWRLDESLDRLDGEAKRHAAPDQPSTSPTRLTVNLVGHSMGGLLLVNTVRLLSEHGRDRRGTIIPDAALYGSDIDAADDIGNHLELDKLILASPDIPLEFLREGRNNYVRSAIRRCRRIYLMSSDRDVVLRYLSTVGNWFTEPSIQMAGLRLGNVYLKPYSADSSSPYRPYIRIMLHSQRAVQPTSAYDLFRKFNYLDCSEMQGDRGVGGVNSVPLPLNPITALPIDILNTLWYLFSAVTGLAKLDVHGGYFQTNTPSFKIFKLLLMADKRSDEEINQQILELIRHTPIRFFPSKPWVMPQRVESPLEETPVP